VRPVYRVCGCGGTSSRRGDGSFNVGLVVRILSFTMDGEGHTIIDIENGIGMLDESGLIVLEVGADGTLEVVIHLYGWGI
jgi:hypothetical protein